MAERNSFKTGSCEMLILHILKHYGDCYAYQISQFIKQLSDGNLFFPEGSLYPSFYKMIDNKYISDYKKQVGKRRIKVYYHIETAGEERLSKLISDYYETTANIEKILDYDYSQLERNDESDE